ncbi:hypothetical protein [Sebaldella sp. S0638]|uniref:hypothetical protein n=1 Tax=Sebaldella sp. S0638 TaxID=2957809 RepID=UPI0020A017F2|nr:hypothetical protein [Sebaldella sp. S0638]MCP1226416.1 hypothetical protein [Sebaldella sp. S0638]
MADKTERRERLIQVSKDGRGADTFRVAVPAKWIRDMKIDYDDRKVEIIYDFENKTILMKKI